MPKEQHFFSILETMNSGRTLTNLETKLEELLDSIADTGTGGELVLTLKVAPKKKNLNEVTATVRTKLPQEAPEKAVFYMDAKNKLVREDPRQMELRGVVTPMPPAEPTVRREDVPQAADQHNA